MYLLDANVFIQAKNDYYGFDFVPAFWDWLDRERQDGRLASVDAVGRELTSGQDALAIWAKTRPAMFQPMDDQAQPSLRALADWAQSPANRYAQAAIAEFLSGADYQLVAYAHAHGHAVVTQEQSSPGSKKSVKIPDACKAFGVLSVRPFKMLRDERAWFVLAHRRPPDAVSPGRLAGIA
jgi:hypothetical protein